MNFIYTIDPNAEEPIMCLDTFIGKDENGKGIDGAQFAKELLTLDAMGKRRIQVWINSEGGSVLDGQKIYSAILNSKCKVDTYNMGMAASISAVIFQAGRTRYMADYARLMYHNPYGGSDKKTLDELRGSIATMVAKRANKTDQEVLSIMDRTTWINATDAQANGFSSETIPTSEANKGRLSRIANEFYIEEVSGVFNKAIAEERQVKIFDHSKKRNMIKVTNKLGLTEAANEESILAGIEAIENKVSIAEAKAKASAEEMQNAKKAMDEAKAALDTLTAKYNEMEKGLNEAKDKASLDAATLMVKGHVNRIGSDEKVLNSWIADAVKDLEGTKAKIEAIPLNKAGANLTKEVKAVAGDNQLGSVINRTMADIRAKEKI